MGAIETTEAPAGIYDALAEPDRAWLLRAATELRAKLRRTVDEVVSSGRLLAQARRRLGREQWEPWLASEAQIPVRSAARLVNVGRVFGNLSDASLRHFTPTALYFLAEPSVPQSIREYAVLQAQDGEEVTAAKVQEWVTLQRDTTPDAPLKLATKDETPPDNYHDPAEVFAEDNWRLLCVLIGTSGTVHISGAADSENDDEAFHGFAIDHKGQRKHASGGTVEQVILRLAGGIRQKRCGGECGLVKPLDQFCKRTDLPDGREYRCKACERQRVKAHTARKTAERKAAG